MSEENSHHHREMARSATDFPGCAHSHTQEEWEAAALGLAVMVG